MVFAERARTLEFKLVRVEGIEPPLRCRNQILSLARLPVPPYPLEPHGIDQVRRPVNPGDAPAPGSRYKPRHVQIVSSTAAVGTVTAVSAAALGLALIAQYGFRLAPCELCTTQRLPYLAILVLGLLALMPAVPPSARRQVVLLCGALFALNAGVACYHAGVEYGWWQGPTACTGGIGNVSLSDVMAALNRPGTVSCAEPALFVLGVSMAGANFMACILFALACLWAAKQPHAWIGQ